MLQLVQSLGMPGWLAYASAGAELGGGILVLIGLVTRIASLFILINMLVAIVKVHLHNGLTSAPGKTGYEFPLALAAIALACPCLGPAQSPWIGCSAETTLTSAGARPCARRNQERAPNAVDGVDFEGAWRAEKDVVWGH